MIFGVRAVILTALIGLFATGVTSCTVGAKAYYAGRAKEKAQADRVIANMLADHRARVDESNKRADAMTEQWRLARQGADHAQEAERAATRRALAAAHADADRLRSDIAAAAGGRIEASDDTVTACRDRAATLGSLLAEALRDGQASAADAEDLAAGVRALQRAWPVE